MFYKNIHFHILIVLLLFIGNMISCGGSWMDVQQVMFFTDAECSDKELEESKTNELKKMLFKETCSRVGKAFFGEVRCKNKNLQVKCE